MSRTLTAAELQQQLFQVTLLDVRRAADREASPEQIPGARWNDPGAVDDWIASLPRDKPIVLYCARGGSVSNSVLDRLLSSHFNARYLEGGIEAWKNHGGDTESS